MFSYKMLFDDHCLQVKRCENSLSNQLNYERVNKALEMLCIYKCNDNFNSALSKNIHLLNFLAHPVGNASKLGSNLNW